MAHEIAKLMLEHAGTFDRPRLSEWRYPLGMPLSQIETYLDWLDATRGPVPEGPDDEKPTADHA